MSEVKRIVLWCAGAPNQRALAHKVAAKFDLAGIIIDSKKHIKHPPLLRRVMTGIQDRLFFKDISGAWRSLLHAYELQFPEWPKTRLIHCDSINSDEAYEFTKALDPDLVIVSGTSMVRKKMLGLRPHLGIMNLHTGLSPYIKGGPNCTNWCLSSGQFEMIGNTIMWINEGIDTGNIITTETTPLSERTSLDAIHWQVMEHAHYLYLRAIHYVLVQKGPHQSIPQDEIAKGKLYLNRMWNFKAKLRLMKNLPHFRNFQQQPDQAGPVTVSLPKTGE